MINRLICGGIGDPDPSALVKRHIIREGVDLVVVAEGVLGIGARDAALEVHTIARGERFLGWG